MAGILVGVALHNLAGQRLGNVAVERLGDDGQLRELGHGLDAGDDGYGDAHRPCLSNKLEVFRVVEEQLRHGVLRTEVLLLLEVLHVALQVGSLLVLLRVAGHADVETPSRILDGCAVGKEAVVEALHLADEVRRVGMTAGCRREAAVLLGLVAAQQQQVVDAEKLQVYQFVFYIFHRGTAADDVRLHRYVVALLYGGGNGDGSRASAHAAPLKPSVGQFAVDILRVVGGDIDEGRLQCCQFVDVGKEAVGTRSLQRRQHLEGELPVACMLADNICYAHKKRIWLQSYNFSWR